MYCRYYFLPENDWLGLKQICVSKVIIYFFRNNNKQTAKIMNIMKYEHGQREALKGVLRIGILKTFEKLVRGGTLVKAFSSKFVKHNSN